MRSLWLALAVAGGLTCLAGTVPAKADFYCGPNCQRYQEHRAWEHRRWEQERWREGERYHHNHDGYSYNYR